jgi:cysteine desulfuration protein SufE
MTSNKIQDTIIEEFSAFNDWLDMYEHIIAVGKTLPHLDDRFKTEEHLITGCQSSLWLMGAKKDDNTIIFQADSDALITKGIIALLLRVYNNRTPHEIVTTEPYFIETIGLQSNLSPARANGVAAIINRIKKYACEYIDE